MGWVAKGFPQDIGYLQGWAISNPKEGQRPALGGGALWSQMHMYLGHLHTSYNTSNYSQESHNPNMA